MEEDGSGEEATSGKERQAPRGVGGKCLVTSWETLANGLRSEWRIEGVDGSEVSKVAAVMAKAREGQIIQISNSTVGLVARDIQDVQSIAVNVAHLAETGATETAEALRQLGEVVANSEQLDAATRTDLLDLVEELAHQATLPVDARAKQGVLKGLAGGLASGLGAAGGLASAWQVWGPTVLSHFGLS